MESCLILFSKDDPNLNDDSDELDIISLLTVFKKSKILKELASRFILKPDTIKNNDNNNNKYNYYYLKPDTSTQFEGNDKPSDQISETADLN